MKFGLLGSFYPQKSIIFAFMVCLYVLSQFVSKILILKILIFFPITVFISTLNSSAISKFLILHFSTCL